MTNIDHHKDHLSKYLNKHKGLASKHEPFEKSSSVPSSRVSSRRPRINQRKPPPLIRGKATLQHLPHEILLKIFSFLGAQDLLKSAGVCKLWHELANDNLLWEKIFQTQGKLGKDDLSAAPPDQPLGSYWKSLCVKRCSERRNNRSFKLLKKIHPYTGLPSATGDILKKIGISFQLLLIDSDGNEHGSTSRDIFYHSMSLAVRWHDLTTFPISRLRRAQVFSCNPLFFDDNGRAVKSGPYQKSLMTSVDINWSRCIREVPPIAGDDTVSLHAVPGSDLVIATWKADGELAFVATGYHHHCLVQRCLLGTSAIPYEMPSHQPVPDDIDSSYGLHGYTCTLEVRNLRKVWWSQQFTNLTCRTHNICDGHISFELIRRDHPTDHVVMSDPLRLHWKTDLFKGIVKNVAWMDFTLQEEQSKIFWAFSNPIVANSKEKSKNLEFDYNGEDHLSAVLTGDKGQVMMELSQMDDDRTFVSHLEVKLTVAAVNKWFLTRY